MKVYDLNDPTQARAYIRNHWPKVKFVELSSGRTVFFDRMTDEDAMLVGQQLWEMQQLGEAKRGEKPLQ